MNKTEVQLRKFKIMRSIKIRRLFGGAGNHRYMRPLNCESKFNAQKSELGSEAGNGRQSSLYILISNAAATLKCNNTQNIVMYIKIYKL